MGTVRNSLRITALVALLLPLAALADFKKDYEKGLEAIEGQNWQQAVSSLETAIADNGEPAERVRMYGMKFIPYLPYYNLGLARYRLGDCQGAIDAWDQSVAKGVIQSQNEFATLQRSRQECASQVIDVSTIAATARNLIDALAESARDLERLSNEDLLSREWSDEWRQALADATAAAQQLPGELAAAEAARDADAIEAISNRASDLRSRVQQATGSASQRLAAIRAREEQRIAQARQNARRDLASNLSAARSVLQEDAPDQSSRAIQQQLESLVARADQLGSGAATDDLVSINRDLNTRVRSFRQSVQNYRAEQQAIASRTPPPGLKAVAEAYFAGDYDRTIQLADPNSFGDERERIQAHLFRAAARYNMYLLDNGRSQQLLEQAQADIRNIKSMDRRFTPYIAAFSPRFTKFFEQTQS